MTLTASMDPKQASTVFNGVSTPIPTLPVVSGFGRADFTSAIAGVSPSSFGLRRTGKTALPSDCTFSGSSLAVCFADYLLPDSYQAVFARNKASRSLYYGHRDYNPEIGRWNSRDPIEDREKWFVVIENTDSEWAVVISDALAEDMVRNSYSFLSNNGINWADLLGLTGNTSDTYRREPSLSDLIGDDFVFDALVRAWTDSAPDATAVRRGQPGSSKREQGGWIIWKKNTGKVIVERVSAGSRDSITLGTKPAETAEQKTVASFHTHPNTIDEDYLASPSPDDINFTNTSQVPMIIMTHGPMETVHPGAVVAGGGRGRGQQAAFCPPDRERLVFDDL